MGLKNTMACYDSTGRSFLLKRFLDITHYYDKVKLYGIKLIRQKESYSSQCSPKSEKVGKAFAQKQNRKYRGLYVDGTDIYNADCVGAYNILRLYLQKENIFVSAVLSQIETEKLLKLIIEIEGWRR